MKKELHPGIAATIIVVFVIGVVVFIYRGVMTGPGNKGPLEVGNPGPFSPGGAANSKAQTKK